MKKIICFLVLFFAYFFYYSMEIYAINDINLHYETGRIPTFEEIQDELPSGVTKTLNKGGAKNALLNIKIWVDKKIVVYGNYASITGNDYKTGTKNLNNEPYYLKSGYSRGEYRYHGYDISGNYYTNIHFIDDIKSNVKLEDKFWAYQPWRNDLVDKVFNKNENDIRISLYNERALNSFLADSTATRQWINNGITYFSIKNAASNDGNTVPMTNGRYEFVDFLNVLSPPTTQVNGEGRMFHIVNNNGAKNVYYQTFSIEKLKAKELLDIEVTHKATPVEVSYFKDGGSKVNGQDKVELNIILQALYKDEEYYRDDIKRVLYYTRSEISSWRFILKPVADRETPNTSNGAKIEIKSAVTKEMIFKSISDLDKKTGTEGCVIDFEYIVTMTLKDGRQKSMEGVISLPVKVNIVEKVDIEEVIERAEKITDTSPFEIFEAISADAFDQWAGDSLPDPPDFSHLLFEPKLNIPSPAYDIVPYAASDNTDLSNVKWTKVFIEGTEINYDDFFGGSYIFGEDMADIHMVEVVYCLSDDKVIRIINWVQVLDTKPRAQFKLNGSYKQNRKLSVSDTSSVANDTRVISKFPLTGLKWNIVKLDSGGEEPKILEKSLYERDMVFKKPGAYRIELAVTNSLGRHSDIYGVDFEIYEDLPPFIEMQLLNTCLARGENLSAWHYKAGSHEGDILTDNLIEIFYDENFDGVCEKKVFTGSAMDRFISYTPQYPGKYLIVNTVAERFGEDTISAFIDEGDIKRTVKEYEFWVDNYAPLTELSVNIPSANPKADILIAIDENLADKLVPEYKSRRIEIANNISKAGLDTKVEILDLKTYIYELPVVREVNTGSDYPADTHFYESEGYSGTLALRSVSNNPYTVMVTVWDNRTVTEFVREIHSNTITRYYTNNEMRGVTYSWGNVSYHPSVPVYRESRLVGYIYPSVITHTDWIRSMPDTKGNFTESCTYTVLYEGYVSYEQRFQKQVPMTVNNYTGFYSGNVYKSVKQSYEGHFRPESYKWVLFLSGGGEIDDIKNILQNTKARLGICAITGDRSKTAELSPAFYLQGTNELTDIINTFKEEIFRYLPVKSGYYTLIDENVNIIYSDFDNEGDQIIKQGFQTVHDPYVFDNSNIFAGNANKTYIENDFNIISISKFTVPGKYGIYRRITDLPMGDSRFSQFSYDSNVAEIEIFAHRKPVAALTYLSQFDPSDGMYKITWMDMSYDPDFEFSREDKGIAATACRIKKEGSEVYYYYLPEKLEGGKYALEYKVMDIYGAWSDDQIISFEIDELPPLLLSAFIEADKQIFTPDDIPAGESIVIKNLIVSYPYNANVKLSLLSEKGDITYYSLNLYGNENPYFGTGKLIWDKLYINLPNILMSGKYTLLIEAEGTYNKRASYKRIITVNTPISLKAAIDDEQQFKYFLYTEENHFIKINTSIYVDKIEMIFNGNVYTGKDFFCFGEGYDIYGPTGLTWIIYFNISENDDITNINDILTVTAYLPSGEWEQSSLDFAVEGIAAVNFTVDMILDTNWRGFYFNEGIKKADVRIPAYMMPINILNAVSWGAEGVKAGAMATGSINIRGRAQGGELIAIYSENGGVISKNVPLKKLNDQNFSFEMIIPETVDQKSFIRFDIEIYKNGKTFYREKWIDIWDIANPDKNVFYINGKVKDDLIFHQGN